MKLTDEQLMDILKEAIKAIAIKYNSIVAENEETVVTERPVTKEVAPKENPKTVEEPTKVAPKEELGQSWPAKPQALNVPAAQALFSFP